MYQCIHFLCELLVVWCEQRPLTLAAMGLGAVEEVMLWVANALRDILYPSELKVC